MRKYSTVLRSEFSFVADLNSMACQASSERAWSSISRFYDNCKDKKPGKKGYPKFQKDNRSVEYKTSGWTLHPTKRRITFTDNKGIGELKLLGSWDIQTFTPDAVKRVRIVRREYPGTMFSFVWKLAGLMTERQSLPAMKLVLTLDLSTFTRIPTVITNRIPNSLEKAKSWSNIVSVASTQNKNIQLTGKKPETDMHIGTR